MDKINLIEDELWDHYSGLPNPEWYSTQSKNIKMNSLDKQYTDLLQDILDNGIEKEDRTGTGTISVFGRQIRHKMSEGFPLLTTKKMAWKAVVTELLWFLKGSTNIKFLVDNGCNIWNGDCYQSYLKEYEKGNKVGIVNYSDPLQYLPYTKDQFINKIKTDDEFAKTFGELGPIYGKQWRSWTNKEFRSFNDGYFGYTYDDKPIDQISNLINELKTNPDSRRLMVNAYNIGELDQMVLPPCHYGFQIYTRELSERERIEMIQPYGLDPLTKEGRDRLWKENNLPTRAISLMFNMRSNDVPLGLPFNIASYGLLLEIIAKVVNMVPDELIGNLGDTHIYKNQVDGVKEQLTREPFPLPKLNINTEFWPKDEGLISASGFISVLDDDNFIKCLMEDIQLSNYQSHPVIKIPLSN